MKRKHKIYEVVKLIKIDKKHWKRRKSHPLVAILSDGLWDIRMRTAVFFEINIFV